MKKIELVFHNAKEELPEKSALYLVKTKTGTIIEMNFSKKHQLFNVHDFYDDEELVAKHNIPVDYWAEIGDLKTL